ncbi:MAG: GPI inositol-deacylase [Planctomycetota bacterium]|nr:GPI inositol-deacylase [Planctomycetota bacterium]
MSSALPFRLIPWCFFVLAACPGSAAGSAAEASEPPPAIRIPGLDEFSRETELRATKKGKVHVHGLVATINYKEFAKRKIEANSLKLPGQATGFKDSFEVTLALQPRPAPLAVILLGFAQEADDKLAKAWMHDAYGAGCHVVTFPSVFANGFNEASGHGVAGNVEAEAGAVARLVDALLKHREDGKAALRERVTSVRLLGASYGGILALNLMKHPGSAAWPVDRVLVLSPPVSLCTAARRLDECFQNDLPLFGPSLIKLLDGFTPDENQPNAREESLMRAGIAYDFLGALEDILKSNERRYRPGMLNEFKARDEEPEARKAREKEARAVKDRHELEKKELKARFPQRDDDEKQKLAYEDARRDLEDRQKVEKEKLKRTLGDSACWTFTDYLQRFCAPYWKKSPEELCAKGEIAALLANPPPYVEVVIARDDPLNEPKELDALCQKCAGPSLIILPHGGHLGFAGTDWVQKTVREMFKP